MKKRLFQAAFAICLLVFCAANAFAIDPYPHQSEDLGGGLILYMTAPSVASYYPVSGVWRGGELLYEIDVPFGVWIWNLRFYFSCDGMSFLSVPHGWRPDSDAIGFYRQGVFVYEHDILALLRGGRSSLEREYTDFGDFHMRWDIPSQRYHDRESGTLRVVTVEGTEIIFDLSTGMIVPAPPADSNQGFFRCLVLWFGIAVVLGIILLLAAKFIR